jgi:error-prone DNA polymerase
MCRVLTLGKSRAGKGQCNLGWDDLGAWNEGMIGILLTQDPDDNLKNNIARTRAIFGDRSYCAPVSFLAGASNLRRQPPGPCKRRGETRRWM